MQHYSPLSLRAYNSISPSLGTGVLIDPSAVVIGDVVLGDDSSIWPQVTVRGDVNKIRVGERTSIQDGSVLHVSRPSESNPDGWALHVGSDVTVGHSVTLHGCTIGDRVLVGMGAIVMDGVTVESDVIIAAGALVTPGKQLRSGYLYAGSPAKETRPLKDSEMAFFVHTANNYVKLKNEHIEQLES